MQNHLSWEPESSFAEAIICRRATAEERVAALDEELAARERQLTEQLRAAQAASVAQLGEVEVRGPCRPRSRFGLGAEPNPWPQC